jgi:phosphoglycerate kinase
VPLKCINQLQLKNKKIFIRSDLNVPIKDGIISSTSRIDASIPTINYAINEGGFVLLTSHMGRPEEGKYDEIFSLKPVVDYLKKKLGIKVELVKNYLDQDLKFKTGILYVLENTRFNAGEKNCEEGLSKRYAEIADVFVMDAFGTAHRKESSTYGIGKYVNEKCAGFLFNNEIQALTQTFDNPKKPMIAIVGGSKVSTKLSILKKLSQQVDGLILGGGILNTFLAAQGFNIGKSLYEEELMDDAKFILNELVNRKVFFPKTIDVVCGKELREDAKSTIKNISEIEDDDMIFDIGPKSFNEISSCLDNANTILWNGPLGVFEFDQFSNGTEQLAKSIAKSKAFSLAGGGDTIAAIEKYHITKEISYISTAGGAFLEFAEGKKLPAIEILEQNDE